MCPFTRRASSEGISPTEGATGTGLAPGGPGLAPGGPRLPRLLKAALPSPGSVTSECPLTRRALCCTRGMGSSQMQGKWMPVWTNAVLGSPLLHHLWSHPFHLGGCEKPISATLSPQVQPVEFCMYCPGSNTMLLCVPTCALLSPDQPTR